MLVGLLLSALSGCAIGNGQATLGQSQGLPALHRLNWPASYYAKAVWSPNGRWIAALVGPDYATSQLGVIGPDGKYHRDLSGWGCGESDSFTFAWLPDSSLSCLSESGKLIIDSYPFTHPHSVSYNANLVLGNGGVWLPRGTTFIISSLVDPSDPTHEVHDAGLYIVRDDATVIPERLTPKDDTALYPNVSPQGSRLSYLLETDPTTGNLNLMLSQVTYTASGLPQLDGTPQTVAEGVDSDYSWSPNGRWIAVRHLSYRGGDKIYLVNPDKPTQTVDVVLADQVGQQMMNPIWSPDGKQMIVFSVGFSTAQPYELDIGSYLASKGLQP
jgi:Tol biopolymer transport system component